MCVISSGFFRCAEKISRVFRQKIGCCNFDLPEGRLQFPAQSFILTEINIASFLSTSIIIQQLHPMLSNMLCPITVPILIVFQISCNLASILRMNEHWIHQKKLLFHQIMPNLIP